ncbi:MAG: SAM-dependent methyltransferase [Phycisphaerae bacterium]
MTDKSRNQADDRYKSDVLAAVQDEGAFLRMTLNAPSGQCPWEHVAVRPVELHGRRFLQAAYQAGKKHITKNFPPEEVPAAMDELLALGFFRVHVQLTSGDIHVRITRKGKALITHGRPSRAEAVPRLEHDHRKSYLLPVDKPDPFLVGVGIMSASGKVKGDMADKFRQINEFLRVIDQCVGEEAPCVSTGSEDLGAGRTSVGPLSIIDCGCGSAYLTFAAFHYLRHIRGREVTAVGVDVNADLIAKCLKLRDELGWTGLDFQACAIADYDPPGAPGSPPEIVVSLHACDTATDEAIARGVAWGSRTILAAPCCQHELHTQIEKDAFRTILRHGILKERLADILTDAFRAAALRVMGYRTRVFQFISPDATSKNLMIEARKITGPDPGRADVAREYLDLKQFWNVTPFIERALGAVFQARLASGRIPVD